MPTFRVVDLNPSDQPAEFIVEASKPETAARLALGVELVRSGAARDLRARVYFQHPGQSPSMVRLYSKVSDRTANDGEADVAASQLTRAGSKSPRSGDGSEVAR